MIWTQLKVYKNNNRYLIQLKFLIGTQFKIYKIIIDLKLNEAYI